MNKVKELYTKAFGEGTKSESCFSFSKKGMMQTILCTLTKDDMNTISSSTTDEEIMGQISVADCKCDKMELVERLQFAIIAIHKFGTSIEEAKKLVINGTSIQYCFDKIMNIVESQKW